MKSLENLAFYSLIAAVVTAYLYKKFWRKDIEKNKEESSNDSSNEVVTAQISNLIEEKWILLGMVETLYIYPIKFGRAHNVFSCDFTLQGMYANDRYGNTIRDKMFIVYDQNTKHVQNQNYDLSRVNIKVKGYRLVVYAKYYEPKLILHMGHLINMFRKNVKCTYGIKFNKEPATINCIDCGRKAAVWITKFLTGETNSSLRLGYIQTLPQIITGVDIKKEKDNKRETSFIYPMCWSSTSIDVVVAQYDWLKKKILNEDWKDYVETWLLHPNILISSFPSLSFFEENKWKWMKIGNAIFTNVKLHSRYMEENKSDLSDHLNDSSNNMKLRHLTINCGLCQPGIVTNGDKVLIYFDDDHEQLRF